MGVTLVVSSPEIKKKKLMLCGIAVIVASLAGNALVLFVVGRHRKLKTNTNFFLANLAAADLCVGVFCVLPNLSLFLSPYWVLGKVRLLYKF